MNNTDGLRREILHGDVLEQLKTLPAESVDMSICSPPYWALRDYGIEGQLGLEPTFTEYINKLVSVFDEVKRVLKKEGTCWVNLGDTFNGSGGAGGDYNEGGMREGQPKFKQTPDGKIANKCMLMIPERFAIEMINHGWILRSKIIWHKPNAMPSSAKDRFTVDWEYLFMFAKSSEITYWVNHKTGQTTKTKPLGTKGIEGIDWDWEEKLDGKKYKESNWDGRQYYFETQYQPYADWIFKDKRINKIQTEGKLEHGKVKDYEAMGIDGGTKSRDSILKGIKMPPIGGIKQAGGDNPTYSGNTPEYGAMGAIKRCVWTIPTKPFSEAHFATYPEELVETPIKAGCPVGGIVLDPFFGSGTTGLVAMKLGRDFVGVELNAEYIKIAKKRLFKGCEPLI